LSVENKQQDNANCAFSAVQLMEVIGSAWPGIEVDYDRLFLFDRLQRGDHDWNFLIVTRSQGSSRLELAAVAFELDEQGVVTTRLESRKASIPAGRLAEVVEGMLMRLDETGCDYREYDISRTAAQKSPALYLAELIGIESGVADEPDEHGEDLQPGESDSP
jgi:hypothetical protein